MQGLRSHNAVTKEQYDDIDRLIVKYKLVTKSLEENRMVCARLLMMVPDASMDTIIAVTQNKPLLSRFLDAKCKHHSSIERAIEHITQDDILMYVTELHLYGVFQLDHYLNFVKEVSELYLDDRGTYTPKQVILSGFPQRIAFICAGDEKFIGRIKDYCELYFKTTVHVKTEGNKTDMVVSDPMMKNLDESRVAFKEFFSYVNSREPVSPLQLTQDVRDARIGQYILSSIGDHINATLVEEIVKKLGSIPVTYNITLTQCKYINIGGDTINNAAAVNENEETKGWIRKNPPLNREKKLDYYNRYKDANEKHIAENQFAKIVPTVCGCQKLKSNGINYWIYK